MRRVGALLAAAGVASAALLTITTPAGAITVSTEAELRAAYSDATETTIDLAGDVTLTDCAAGDLDRSSAVDLTINGNGFTITQTCPGQRVITQSDSGGTLTLVAVTITGGAGTGIQATGGGIFTAGPLVIRDSAVVENTTGPGPASTGGLAGGLFGQAVTIERSTISGNTAAGGTSIFNGLGGAMASSGPIEIIDSVVADNLAGASPDSGGGAGAIFTNNSVTITRSTLTGNVAEAAATSGGNGGAVSTNGPVTLVNSTVTGNTAEAADGDGGFNGGVGSNDLSLIYSTIVANNAGEAANVSGTARTVFGTVVAQPLGGGQNCSAGTVTSNGDNFSDDASCAFTNAGQGDRENAGDPMLGAVGDNGGPTPTMLPQAGSPLVDAIPVTRCQADGATGVTTDQRGVTRPQQAGCDVGAVEVEAPPGPPAAGAPGTPGTPGAAVPVSALVVRFTG